DYNYISNFLNPDNTLDFEKILLKFQEFMKAQYSKKDKGFLEKDGRLVFLAFLKPIINGKGYDFKEVQISEEKRLDVVVTYADKKYVVELKKWYNPAYHQKGIKQLEGYLERQNLQKGYLLIFDFDAEKKNWKQERITSGGKDIFAVWV
ncbi:MAG: AAA family ATPase, partial [Bacteroidetes bacterium 4484_276]